LFTDADTCTASERKNIRSDYYMLLKLNN